MVTTYTTNTTLGFGLTVLFLQRLHQARIDDTRFFYRLGAILVTELTV